MGWRLVKVESFNDVERDIVSTSNVSEHQTSPNIEHLLNLRFSELKNRNLGIKIYSEFIGDEIWLCTNKTIATQLKLDDPISVVYTLDELQILINQSVVKDDLKKLHDAKKVFPYSTIKTYNQKIHKNDISAETEKHQSDVKRGKYEWSIDS